MKVKREKIFVGISGGVDSSVAAYLLLQEGYEVHGVFIKTWAPEWVPCTWVDEKRDAMRICALLDIPFHFLDCEAEYKQGVAEYMISEYRAGRTPNPDVMCNKVIKFGSFLEYALKEGADYIATGHYARVNHKKDGTTEFLTSKDFDKDQSYFLWTLTQQQLQKTLFPIGDKKKSDIRAIAARAGLFTAAKKDSQGICFLGDIDMKAFLKHYITPEKGEVINEGGQVIGSHDGAWYFTLGERHGFSVFNTETGPHFVIAKDVERNVLVVSHTTPEIKEIFGQKKVVLTHTNWIAEPQKETIYTAQIRYHGKHTPCTISGNIVTFLEHPGTISPGQSVVLYKGDICIGGGVIA